MSELIFFIVVLIACLAFCYMGHKHGKEQMEVQALERGLGRYRYDYHDGIMPTVRTFEWIE